MSYYESWEDVYARNDRMTKLQPGDIIQRRLMIKNSKHFSSLTNMKKNAISANNEKKNEYKKIEVIVIYILIILYLNMIK